MGTHIVLPPRSSLLPQTGDRSWPCTPTADEGPVPWPKREISPLLPRSCRYIPTCSEYAMEAFREFGAAKGLVLTACRLARCAPWGGPVTTPPNGPLSGADGACGT